MSARTPQRKFERKPSQFKGRTPGKFKKKFKAGPEPVVTKGQEPTSPPPEFLKLHDDRGDRDRDVLAIADSYILNGHAEAVCRAIINGDNDKSVQAIMDKPVENKAIYENVAREHAHTASMLFKDSQFAVPPPSRKGVKEKSSNKWLESIIGGETSDKSRSGGSGFLESIKGSRTKIEKDSMIIATLLERNTSRNPGEVEEDVLVRAREGAKMTAHKVENGIVNGESSLITALNIATTGWQKQEASRKKGGEEWKKIHTATLENLSQLTDNQDISATSKHLKLGVIQAYNKTNEMFHNPALVSELHKRAKKLQIGVIEPKVEKEALSLIPEETAASYSRLKPAEKRAFWVKTTELTDKQGALSRNDSLKIMCLFVGVIAKDNRDTAVRVADDRNQKGNAMLAIHDEKTKDAADKKTALAHQKAQQAAQHAHGLIDEAHGHLQRVAGAMNDGLEMSHPL